ncbi:MAG: flippase-like domain-containing protein, partial [Gemmataceae bacterium]|nr:flippase-like domain-containing protein [Gemmataceae bacterium]
PTGLCHVWDRHAVQGRPIHWGFFLAALFAFCAAMFLTLVRWYHLVLALDLPLTFRDAMRYGLVGIFFNTFLPGSVGGDIVKAAVLARGQKRRTAAVATVVMDRAIALWALVWFVALLGTACWFLGFLAGGVASFIVTTACVIVGVTGLVWVLLGFLPERRAERFAGRLEWLPGVGKTLAELWRAVWVYRKKPRVVYKVMLLSWVGHVGFVSAFFFGIMAFWSPEMGLIPGFAQHFLLVPMGLVMQALVPTPGGAGGGEWGFAALYMLFNAPEANGVLASLIQRVFSWLAGLAGWIAYLVAAPSLPQEAPAPSEAAPPAQPSRALAG